MKMNLNINQLNNATHPIFTAKKKETAKIYTKPLVTDNDRVYFQDYMLAKQLDLKITKNDFDNLLQYNNDEFVIRTNDFFADKFKVSSKIKPEVVSTPDNDNYILKYSPENNQIVVSKYALSQLNSGNNDDKIYTIARMRGEWQHYKQVTDVFRHEKLGDTAVKYYSQSKLYEMMDTFEKIADITEKNKNNTGITIDYKKTPALFKFLNFVNVKHFENFKKNVRKELGKIKEDSPQSDKVKQSAQVLFNVKLQNKNDINEREAKVASFMEYYKYYNDKIPELNCFISLRKVAQEASEKFGIF